MKAGFEDDAGFKNLSDRAVKDPTFHLHRLSYFCQNANCPECPGIVSYKKVKEKIGYDPDTKKFYGPQGDERKYEDWDPEYDSVQLKGDIQTKENAPEGSKCECFCHQAPSKPKSIGTMAIHKYAQKELAPDVAERLT